jgi:hypothetical protein
MKTKNEIKFTIETVTPEMAKCYLESNFSHQRSLGINHVNHLAQQMANDQWQMNGEPIIFDRINCLIDGQHRMHAIIKYGKPVQMAVIRGVDAESFMTINRGRTRTGGDLFAINGTPNSKRIAAVTANVINYRRAMKTRSAWMEKDKSDKSKKFYAGSLNSNIRASGADLIEEYNRHKDAYVSAMKCGNLKSRMLSQSIVATVAAIAIIEAGHKENEVMFFWESFASGKGENGSSLDSKDPIFILREKCIANGFSRAKLPSNTLIMLAIKAWNAFSSGKPLSVLRVIDGEPCPAIL